MITSIEPNKNSQIKLLLISFSFVRLIIRRVLLNWTDNLRESVTVLNLQRQKYEIHIVTSDVQISHDGFGIDGSQRSYPIL